MTSASSIHPESSHNVSAQKRCIVVGAGLAGMSAALHLARHGVQVQLIEAHAYLGGRARSFLDEASGELIDNGQHLLMGCYNHVLDLVRFCKNEDLLHEQPSLRVVFREPGAEKTVFGAEIFGGQLGAAEALITLKGVGLLAKLRAVQLMLRLQLGAKARADETALAFLQRHRQHETLIHRFWEPLILATLNAAPNLVSAGLLVEVLRRSILAGGRNASLLIPSRGLADLFNGYEQELSKLGSKVLMRTEVSELLYRASQCIGVGTRDEHELRADAVILAVPPRALTRLGMSFPLDHSPIVSVYLWYDKDFVPDDFCALLGTTTQWVFNRRRLCECPEEQRTAYPGHLSLTISAASALAEKSAEQIVEHCTRELQEVFPHAAAKLLHSKVIKERFATFVSTPESERLRPATHTRVSNLFLAGDWTNTGLPATLEGAAQSGIEAAKAVLLHLGS